MKPQALPAECLSERLCLRRHEAQLADTMFGYIDRDRARLRQFLPWVDQMQSVADELAYIQSTRAQWEALTFFDYGIFLRSDGAYLGNLGVHHLAWPHARCELGYWLLSDFEGQGYITEAVACLEQILFGMGFHRIEIRCSSLNKRSAGVPERLGYRREGQLREVSFEQGAWRDTLIYARLRHEHPDFD